MANTIWISAALLSIFQLQKTNEKCLIKVSTNAPDDVETTEGITTFILLEEQVLQDEKVE